MPFVDLAVTDTSYSGLKWAIWGLLMSLIMGWIARSRLQPAGAGDSQQLRHPPSTLIIGLLGFVFFVAIAVISNVFANKTTTWWTTAVFVGFALLSLPIIGDYFAARHEVSAEGLRYGRLVGAGGYVAWSELKRVEFSPSMKWFRLESRRGTVVRLSVMLRGLPEFARLVLDQAPRTAIDAHSLPILEVTARGNPPSVWQA